jgi:L-threonylcarbamoyladenylate synthase
MSPNTIIRPYGTAAIAEAAVLIRSGQPVAVPTETVYGLAADATNGEAVARIYAAKGRPSFNPLIVHVLDLRAADQLGIFNESARALAAAHWPGPLTLVVPRRADSPVASLVTAGLDTIAIRVPAHRAMRALLIASGKPLAAPSANASGTISPTRAAHVLRTLDGRIALIVDDGPCDVGIESTIIACGDGGLRLLRAGSVIIEGARPSDGSHIESPGQLAQHYAPSKPLRLNALAAEADEWLIGFGAVAGHAMLSATGDLIEAAANLFERLHEADLSSVQRIAVAPIPDTGIGTALNDRLRRAVA